jgi:hypothetical protein
LIVDAIRNVQRRKTGLPHINGGLREVEHLAVCVNEGSLLRVTVTISDNLSAIVYRSSITGLGKSAECAKILHRTAIEKKGARGPIAGLAVAYDNPGLINRKRLAVSTTQRPEICQMACREQKRVRRAVIRVVAPDDLAAGANPIRSLERIRVLYRDTQVSYPAASKEHWSMGVAIHFAVADHLAGAVNSEGLALATARESSERHHTLALGVSECQYIAVAVRAISDDLI